MTRSPSKLVLAMAVLLAVWVAVFWLYKPHTGGAAGGGITYGEPPDLARALVAVDPMRAAPPGPVTPLPVAPLPGQAQPAQPESPLPGKRLVPPEFSEYTVQKGDNSFAAISKRFFGTTRHADAISRSNPFVTPDKLYAGRTRLRIPKDPTNIQGRIEEVPGVVDPSPAAGSSGSGGVIEHTVAAGETLGAISKRYYGTATRWKAIMDANSDQFDKPEKLRAGMTIHIPPKD